MSMKEIHADKAIRHHLFVKEAYKKETEKAIKESTITDVEGKDNLIGDHLLTTKVKVLKDDVISATLKLYTEEKRICILNFASYKHPGGKYLDGSMTQEESICHNTNLYEILSSDLIQEIFYIPNHKRLNRGLYNDNMIYTKDVILFDNNQKPVGKIDVITCAAPNAGTVRRYGRATTDEIHNVMRKRIRSILNTALMHSPDILILGAFGCGVFKNDPKSTSEIFMENIKFSMEKDSGINEIVFAIPDERNFLIFSDTIGKELDLL